MRGVYGVSQISIHTFFKLNIPLPLFLEAKFPVPLPIHPIKNCCFQQLYIQSILRFFNSCANYNAQMIKFRAENFAAFGNIPTPTLEHILHGDQNMNTESNDKCE